MRSEQTESRPHLCGWALLQRWYNALNHGDDIPDLSRQYALPDNYVQTVEMRTQSSIEDARTYEMPHDLVYLAARLRKNFLWFLARRDSVGQPVQQCPLVVAIPTPADPRPALPAQIQAHDLYNRIAERLQIFHQFPGWATSDEIDYTLEILRLQEPNTLFCPPAMWNHQTATLNFLNDFQPTYEPYRHIIWRIAMQNHWITVEVYRYDQFTQLCVTLPPIWRHMVQHLIGVIIRTADVDQNVLQVHYLEQYDAEGTRGYATLFRLFRRLQLAVGPIGDPQIRILLAHDFAEDIQTTRIWNGSVRMFLPTSLTSQSMFETGSCFAFLRAGFHTMSLLQVELMLTRKCLMHARVPKPLTPVLRPRKIHHHRSRARGPQTTHGPRDLLVRPNRSGKT